MPAARAAGPANEPQTEQTAVTIVMRLLYGPEI